MDVLEFVGFDRVNSEEILPVVNEPALRRHLVDHPLFDSVSIRDWMNEKINYDSMPGCRVRAVYIDGVLAGWCGIQPDEQGFEMAIVISRRYWGAGISIFRTLMCWAGELGHKEVMFHLLETRPEYRFLKRMAARVRKTEIYGRVFTTYILSVAK